MLGSGFVCDFYMQALRYVPDQRVVVNFSKTQAKAEDFAQRWKVPESTTDMQAAIERDDVDLVVVGLPNFVHRDACIAAAEAGKAVVCTKPLGRNAPEAAEILQAVRAHGVFHGYLETEAFMPDVLRAKQAVQDGAIGKVLIVRAREAHTGSHATYAWDAATSGGGPLLGMGVHAVAACRLFIGKDVMPQEVMCWADTLEHDVPFEDNAVALVRFENRSLGQVESGWSNHGGMDIRTEIYGDRRPDPHRRHPRRPHQGLQPPLHGLRAGEGRLRHRLDLSPVRRSLAIRLPRPDVPLRPLPGRRHPGGRRPSRTATSPTPSSTPPTAAPNQGNGNRWICRD